jgi:MraZ protein
MFDRMGRVSVPATFRSTLATNRQQNLFVEFISLYLPAVDGAGSDRMEEMQEQIETLEQFSDEYENLIQMFADAHPMMMDPEGRVVLPEPVKEFAGIDTDVAFVGHGRMFQLWDPARYEEHRAAVRERARRQGTTLPARGGAARRAAGGEA